jgi:hypothetical protein
MCDEPVDDDVLAGLTAAADELSRQVSWCMDDLNARASVLRTVARSLTAMLEAIGMRVDA